MFDEISFERAKSWAFSLYAINSTRLLPQDSLVRFRWDAGIPLIAPPVPMPLTAIKMKHHYGQSETAQDCKSSCCSALQSEVGRPINPLPGSAVQNILGKALLMGTSLRLLLPEHGLFLLLGPAHCPSSASHKSQGRNKSCREMAHRWNEGKWESPPDG